MPNFDKAAREALRFIGLTGNYKGFSGMATAIALVAENEDLLRDVTAELYPRVAEAHGTTSERLQRNFRTLIAACWRDENRTRLSSIAGRPLTQRPTTLEFIDMLANYLVRNVDQ